MKRDDEINQSMTNNWKMILMKYLLLIPTTIDDFIGILYLGLRIVLEIFHEFCNQNLLVIFDMKTYCAQTLATTQYVHDACIKTWTIKVVKVN